MTRASKDIYLTSVLPLVPQILTQIDRRPGSPTKGCFDREYWHHLSVDFPCIEKQESVLTLWLLYKIDHHLNVYKGNPLLLEWLKDGVDFWCRFQRPNGSFDEWYPYENSMTATAFSTQCITECLIQTKGHIKWGDYVYSCVFKAARWIAKYSEHLACNQEAGAILALDNAARITNYEEFGGAVDIKLNNLLSLQNEEGWFSEYGGADIGYSSVTLAYLAQLWKRSYSDKLDFALKKLVSFISNFIHLDSSLGGCYGSRNTEYILPLGAEILASRIPAAADLATKLRLAYSNRTDIGMMNVDHRYLLLHNYFYLQSYIEAGDSLDMPLNALTDFDFKKAGLIGRINKKGQFIASLKKGGVFKIACPEASLTDCGWLVRDSERVLISSHFIHSLEGYFNADGFKVKGKLRYVSTKKLNTFGLVILRIYMLTLGRIEALSRLLKKILRGLIIMDGRATKIEFERNVTIDEKGVTVNDMLRGLSSTQIIYLGGSFSYAFGPSTGTFRQEQLFVKALCFRQSDFRGKGLCVERHFLWNTKLDTIKVNNLERIVT